MLRRKLKIYIMLFVSMICLMGYSQPKEAYGSSEKLLFFTALDCSVLKQMITPMDALDMVKDKFASNFVKVFSEGKTGTYFYRLEAADYYLVYEGLEEEGFYLIHLYEFVTDEPETGLGHTYTYGWYRVNRLTGEIRIPVE